MSHGIERDAERERAGGRERPPVFADERGHAGERDAERAPAIELRDVDAGYGDLAVLEGVSLSVPEGRFLGLVGPNGAGKTTLLRTVNGILEPDGGTVRVAGTDATGLSAHALGRRVATVPQATSLAFDFDVRDAVAMGRTPHRSRFATATREDREAVERALDRTETAELADRSVGEVSGGERQRVLLARALAQETPVLLLDEPTASLDVHHQVRTLELVRDLVDDGKTAVAAIHDLDLAARYCDALAVLADGGIRARGPPEEVLTADVLASAFGARAAVTTNPATGTPAVTALGGDPPAADAPRVHVVGNGRAAARALARLAAAGCRCSAGVLPEGDVAHETARALDLEAVTAPPFARPAGEAVSAARELARTADVTVVAGSPTDPGFEVARESDAVVALDGTDQRRPASDADQSRERVRTTAPTRIVDAVEDAARSD